MTRERTDRKNPMGLPNRSERGAALIIVIWVATILVALFAVNAQRIAAEVASVGREAGRAEAEELARRGFAAAVARLVADETLWDSRADLAAATQTGRQGQGHWTVTVEDEGSKFNLNSFGGAVLQALPGLDGDRLAALLDWRDVDDDIRGGGAEWGYYAGLTPRYEPRNGRLEVLEELRVIKGFEAVSGGAFTEIEQTATVYGPLNVHVMDPEAFEALLVARGFGSSAARLKQDLLVHRAQSPSSPSTVESFRQALASFTQSDLARVQADLTADGTINANTASEQVLRPLFDALGIAKEALDRLFEARKIRVFSSVPQLAEVLDDEVAYQRALGYLTVRSRVFVITASGVSATGERASFRAIVRRELEAGSDDEHQAGEAGGVPSWRVEVLSWQWRGQGGEAQ